MVQTREGNTGSGIDYEDSVKASAILHYYIGLNFLDKFDILSIQLNPFTKFITQAYNDYLQTRNINRTFYLITQSIPEKFLKRITSVLSKMKSKPYSDYIQELDADLAIFNEIDNILNLKNNQELYLFLNSVNIVKKEKLKDQTALKNDDHLIINHLDNASDYNHRAANVFHVLSFIDNYIKSTKIHSQLIDNQAVHTIFEGIVKYKKNKTINNLQNDISAIIDEFDEILHDLNFDEDETKRINYFSKKINFLLKNIAKIGRTYRNDINLLDFQTYTGYKSLTILSHILKIIKLDIASIIENNYEGFIFSDINFDEQFMKTLLNYDCEKREKMNNGQIFKDDNLDNEKNNLFISFEWYQNKSNKIYFFNFFKQLFGIIIDNNNNFLQWDAIYTFTRKKNKAAFLQNIKIELIRKLVYLSNQHINIPLFLVYSFEFNNKADRRFSVPLLIANEVQKIIIKIGGNKINFLNNLNLPEKYSDTEIFFILTYVGYIIDYSFLIEEEPDFEIDMFSYNDYKSRNLDFNHFLESFLEQLAFEFDSDDCYVQENIKMYKDKGDNSDLKDSVTRANSSISKMNNNELEEFKKFLARGSQILENLKKINDNNLIF